MQRMFRILSILTLVLWLTGLFVSYRFELWDTSQGVRLRLFHHWLDAPLWLWLHRNDSAILVGLFVTSALSALLSAIAAHRERKAATRRFRADLCLSCGYSLRGNVSGKCPECGERILIRFRRRASSSEDKQIQQ
jgi:predicted RNA-binding Zn-ribbon protein involved in translation (DUF1610 family)